MKERVLAGITRDKELYFIELEVSQHGDQKPYFAGSGFTIKPISVEDARERTVELLEDGEYWRQAVGAKRTELGLSEWIDQVIEEDGDTSMVDNSLYDKNVIISGEEYIFESLSCGQHEEESLLIYSIPKELFFEIVGYWKKYHLSTEWDKDAIDSIIAKISLQNLREERELERLSLRIIRNDLPEDGEDIKSRLEYLRGEIEAERISYGEIAELQSLAEHIAPGDTLLLQWANNSESEE